MAAFGELDAESQVVLAFRYFREMEFGQIAEALRTSTERVIAMHDAGVLAVHQALLLAVSAALRNKPSDQHFCARPVPRPGR